MESISAGLASIRVGLSGPDPWIVVGGGVFLLLCLGGLVAMAVIGFVTLRKK